MWAVQGGGLHPGVGLSVNESVGSLDLAVRGNLSAA